MLAVPLDGGAPPRTLFEFDGRKHVLSLDGPDVLYTLDEQGTYRQDATDGWIGDRRYMERGIRPRFSSDGGTLRWLEHAARRVPVGDLVSARLDGSAPLNLARNVGQYAEIAPGLVLAADNQAIYGLQNRIVLIDEERRTATLVADGAWGFHRLSAFHFDGPEDRVLVEYVDDASLVWLGVVPLPLPR